MSRLNRISALRSARRAAAIVIAVAISAMAAFAEEEPVPGGASEFPAPQIADEAAATRKLFIVRSSPIITDKEYERRAALLSIEGYHPFKREETASNGDKYFTIEMGTFSEMTAATDLLMRIKQIDSDFYVVGTQSTRSATGGLLDEMEHIFPGAGRARAVLSSGSAEDSLSLLLAQAAGPKTGSVAVKTSADGVEKIVVRRMIKPGDMGTAPGGAAEPSFTAAAIPRGSSARGADDSPALARSGPRAATADSRISRTPSPEPVSEKLRKIAWSMRAEGMDVYLEDESFKGPEGVLVGMFDRQSEAAELGRELQEYGYAVNIIMETGLKDMYYVYADPESAATDMMIVTPEATDPYRASDAFSPPLNPGVEALLNMSKP
ncbi:MAG TPA: hypothetical protein PLK80_14185 [bacterium]|nr:hypothetical protein [bacterium]